MKILTHLNPSNAGDFEADSGFIFQRLLLTALLARVPDAVVFLVCPPATPIIEHPRLHQIWIGSHDFDKYSVRFEFPWVELIQLRELLLSIDVAIINQPELTANYRALFVVCGNVHVRLVTYFHYFPLVDLPHGRDVLYQDTMNHRGLGPVILARQLESLAIADFCLTCSTFAKEFIVASAYALGLVCDPVRIGIVPPPVSFEAVALARTEKRYGRKTLVYNHRLYAHYGTHSIFEWLGALWTLRKDFDVIVTDPTALRTSSRDRLAPDVVAAKEAISRMPFVQFCHIQSHLDYYRILWMCDIALAPIKPSALWSMSAVDAMACGKPLVAPRLACFPEMLGGRAELLYDDEQGFMDRINRLLDEPAAYETEAAYCQSVAENYADQTAVDKFLSVLRVRNGGDTQ